MSMLSNTVRFPGDPKVIRSGARSLGPTDQLAKSLAWFGIGLGLVEVAAAGRVARALGADSSGSRLLIRAFGVREILAGVVTLSTEKKLGLWSRVAGDVLDIAALTSVSSYKNPKQKNVSIALAAVLGATALDLLAAGRISAESKRPGRVQDFRNRTGYPNGLGRPAAGRTRLADKMASELARVSISDETK